MTPRIWQTRGYADLQAVALEHELGVSPVTARLLAIRGLGDLDVAKRFMSPSLDDLHDVLRHIFNVAHARFARCIGRWLSEREGRRAEDSASK